MLSTSARLVSRDLSSHSRRMSSSISRVDATTQYSILPDGRKLCFAEFGKPNGIPVLFCHGYPMSRLEGYGLEQSANRYDVRVIVPDRPGFGQSTYDSRRKIPDWSEDVKTLLNDLQLSKVSFLGASGGGPYALACASKLPHAMIVGSVKMLSSAPLFEAGNKYIPWSSWILWNLSVYTPRLLELFLDLSLQVLKKILNLSIVTKRIDAWLESQPKDDLTDTTTEDRRQRLYDVLFEGFAQGARPTIQEALLLAGSWDMKFEDIEASIEIWHGKSDARAPIEMIRYMAEKLPNCELHEFDGGHIDMTSQVDIIMKQIVAEASEINTHDQT